MTCHPARCADAARDRRRRKDPSAPRAGGLAAVALVAACLVAAAPTAHAGAKLGPVNITRTSGTALEVPLGFISTEAVTCAQFDLVYDPARVALGELATSTGASGHQLATSQIAAGRRRVVLFSPDLSPLQGGYIVRVPLTWLVDGDSGLDVVAVTLASPAPAAVAFTSSTLAPAIASSAGSAGPVGGSQAEMGVDDAYDGDVTYQWTFNGVDIPGATTPSLAFTSVQHFHAGTYAVVVSVHGMVLTSQSFDFTVQAPPPNNARLLNLSTRALAQAGDAILIPGFVLGGTGSKRMLIRGVGPSLARFGVSDTLEDPQLRLVRGGATIAANDDWGTNPNKSEIVTTARAVGAFGLTDGSKDAALLVDLAPGSYTVPTGGAAGGTGVAIVELYDADTGEPPANLINISNRGFVGVGDKVMIPGIVVSDEGPRTFLFRAVGPGLTQFNVSGVLADPVLTVFRGTTAILTNDNWSDAPGAGTTASVTSSVHAFSLAQGSLDAAFVITLPPGSYTVLATGKNFGTGVALVEVYLVP